MEQFIIHELQNLNSVRQGEEFSGTLRAAKAHATRHQVYQGTVLKITGVHGNTIAIKDLRTGKWYDPNTSAGLPPYHRVNLGHVSA